MEFRILILKLTCSVLRYTKVNKINQNERLNLVLHGYS
jgi:hypothetical protein